MKTSGRRSVKFFEFDKSQSFPPSTLSLMMGCIPPNLGLTDTQS